MTLGPEVFQARDVTAYVREAHVKLEKDNATVHTWFIRLVSTDSVDTSTIRSINLDDSYIDLDEDGRLLGVNLAWIEEHE